MAVERELFSPEAYVRMLHAAARWRTVAFLSWLVVFGTLYWGCVTMSECRAQKHMQRAEIIDIATRFASDSPERMEALFDGARWMNIEEAIPLAVLYATRAEKKGDRTQYHVVAARRYLREFDLEVIAQRVRAAALSGAFKDSDALLSRLPELMK